MKKKKKKTEKEKEKKRKKAYKTFILYHITPISEHKWWSIK